MSVKGIKSVSALLTILLLTLSFYLWAISPFRWTGDRESTTEELPAQRRAVLGLPVAGKSHFRSEPVVLTPISGLEDVVTDDDLVTALAASLPHWNPPTVPSLLHTLLLWGKDSEFPSEIVGVHFSSEKALGMLLDARQCREGTVRLGGGYLLESPFGIHVAKIGSQDASELRGEAHFGQLLKVLAYSEVSSEKQVIADTGKEGTVKNILEDAVNRFTLSGEIEFIGIALALWLPPRTTWTSRHGEVYSFDMLVSELISTPLGEGACGGCHKIQAIATILNVDNRTPLLSTGMRNKATSRLREVSQLLEQSYEPSGGWGTSWSGKAINKSPWNDEILDRITVTGHHLEWISLVDDSLRPSKHRVGEAVSGLTSEILSLPSLDSRPFKALLPCSHAARALCLMRNVSPYNKWCSYTDRNMIERDARCGFRIKSMR